MTTERPGSERGLRLHSNLQCHAASNPPQLTAKELDGAQSLYQLNEVLLQHSVSATDIHTMSSALGKLACMGSDSPQGFELLAMHERVWQICKDLQMSVGLPGRLIDLEDASTILGSLEDLVGHNKQLHAEHTIIQVRPYSEYIHCSLLYVACLFVITV
jgi:hypothetical protein